MTNEMKLLRAFIEAQGYEIKETKTQKPFSDGSITGSHELIDYKVTKCTTWTCDSNDKFTDTKEGKITNKSTDESYSEAVARMGQQ